MRGFNSVLPGLLVLLWAGQAAAADCGGEETPCEIEDGFYHALAPAEGGAGAPLVVWLHGAGGRAVSPVRPDRTGKRYTDRGYVFVAPQGAPDPARPNMRDWNVADGYAVPRDDIAFLSAVIDDAVARFDADPDRVLLAGFSRGASMAWDYACARPEKVAAIAAVAGGFWEPMVTTCAAPVHLYHTHGFKDPMVPLEGRKVRWKEFGFHQGNILKGLDVWREVNGCMGKADESAPDGDIWRKRWTGCENGSVSFDLTTGGHGIPVGWSGRMMDWFEALPAASE
ncbi:MAG: PHB depolymerase family esterase [Pseudomonadota bacterium]